MTGKNLPRWLLIAIAVFVFPVCVCYWILIICWQPAACHGEYVPEASRPFYQSVSIMYLESIALPAYTAFAIRHFEQGGKTIVPEVVELLYQ